MMRHLNCWVLRGVLSLTVFSAGSGTADDQVMGQTGSRATPIIAEVFSRPDKFLNSEVAIYGLVIEARGDGQRFLLQDVSEMPLLVVAPHGERITAGSQLMVYGALRHAHGQLELAAERVEYVRVLAGGGCC